jgi:metal-responsive CopG/Arc/MetJ family transcriptional regulator
MNISVTLDDDLGADLDEEVAGGNRSALVATAVRELLDRRRAARAAEWHASLTGDDAEAFKAFGQAW